MKQRLVGLLILSPQRAEASSKKVDQLQARLPGNCVDEQMRMAENRATRLAQLGLSADVHLLAGLIQRVRTQCEIFDMSDPVDPTQDIPTATGLESDIEFLEERKVEGLSERRVPAPRQAGSRWTVERTHSRMNDYGKLRRCTDKRRVILEFYLFLPGGTDRAPPAHPASPTPLPLADASNVSSAQVVPIAGRSKNPRSGSNGPSGVGPRR